MTGPSKDAFGLTRKQRATYDLVKLGRTQQDISVLLGGTKGKTSIMLHTLAKKGYIKSVGWGEWTITRKEAHTRKKQN
jgi:DNA-binding CsgD family transcriptional regulator